MIFFIPGKWVAQQGTAWQQHNWRVYPARRIQPEETGRPAAGGWRRSPPLQVPHSVRAGAPVSGVAAWPLRSVAAERDALHPAGVHLCPKPGGGLGEEEAAALLARGAL